MVMPVATPMAKVAVNTFTQMCIRDRFQGAGKDGVHISRLNAASEVLHELVREEHVVANLAAKGVVPPLAAQLVQLFSPLALLQLVELGTCLLYTSPCK